MTEPITYTVALSDETATAHLMADLALLIGAGDVITLSGDLGAGKTAAARAMIRYLAGDDDLEVPSPTFTLAQSYELPSFPLVHADLYRIDDPNELEEIGLSLVRSFVELHGGKVRVDSVVGKGTTVTCDFPIDQTAHRNAAE